MNKVIKFTILFLLICSEAVHASLFESNNETCESAYDEASYKSDFLRNFMFLSAGKDLWVFGSNKGLKEEFSLDVRSIDQLNKFSQALIKRGTQLVIVPVPTRGLMHSDKVQDDGLVNKKYNFEAAKENYLLLLEQLRNLPVIVPNIETLFEQSFDQDFFFKRDVHWTPYGAEHTAKVIADSLKQHPLYDSLAKDDHFITKYNGMMSMNGTAGRAMTEICGQQYSKQFVPQFITTTTVTEEEDLFGDSAAAEVVLVGTSFSNSPHNYNFAGFLKQNLDIDITNAAVSGGGAEGALDQYLHSEKFHSAPPKLLIWEIPAHNSISKPLIYRQLRPAILQGCTNQTIYLEKEVHIQSSDQPVDVLFNFNGESIENLYSKNLTMDFQFSNPAIRNFSTINRYINGKKEKVDFKRNKRIETEGRFMLDMDEIEHGDQIFVSNEIIINQALEEPVSVKVTLCERPE